MLTRDIGSATICIKCKELIDSSWHDTSKILCPTCCIGFGYGGGVINAVDKIGEKSQ
jgi:hypothetical protein